MSMGDVEAVVFDKDGTLIDVQATWGPAMVGTLTDLIDDVDARRRGAAAIGVDLETRQLAVDSAVIAGSNDQIIDLLAEAIDVDPAMLLPAFEARLVAHSRAFVTALPGVAAVLDAVRAMGLWVGLATNDAEGAARDQLDAFGWLDRFDSVIGYDSGFGAKPAPGMLLASAERAGVEPHALVLVGDTDTDMRTAAAAGCRSVLVHGPVGAVEPTAHLDRLADVPALLAR